MARVDGHEDSRRGMDMANSKTFVAHQTWSQWAWASVTVAFAASPYTYLVWVCLNQRSLDPRTRLVPPGVAWAFDLSIAVWVVAAIVCGGLACSYRSLVRAEKRTGLAVIGALLNLLLPIVATTVADSTHPYISTY